MKKSGTAKLIKDRQLMLSKNRASFHKGHKHNYSTLAPTLTPTLVSTITINTIMNAKPYSKYSL